MSVALAAATAAVAQPVAEVRERFTQQELDSILAPIALYPDSLLSQLLMAATYPDQVADAARWSRANPGLQGEDAVRAVDNEPWDPSVKSLVAFPQVLARLDENLGWTQRLGEAFIAEPELVSDTIQDLRRRADAAGNLESSPEIVVRRYEEDYIIEPASPEVVYVPYYDPRLVYGPWWWPEYEPVYWSPWPGYRWSYGYSGFGWGLGVTLGSGFFYSGFDWPRRYIRFRDHRPFYHHGWNPRYGQRWWHNRDHRRDAHDRWRNRQDGRDGWRDRDGRRVDRRDGWDGRRDGRRDGWDGRRDGRSDRGDRVPRGDRGDRGDRGNRGDRGDRRGDWRGGPAQANASPVGRPATPQLSGSAAARPAQVGAPRARVERPVQRAENPTQRVERPVQRVERPAQRVERPQVSRPMPQRVERAQVSRPMPQRVERAQVQRSAPQRVERAQVQRSAPQRVERAQVQRSAPQRVERAQVQRSAPPTASVPRSAPAREAPRASSRAGASDRGPRGRDR